MNLPEGFAEQTRAVRIITCPSCAAKHTDTWPADNVPPYGRFISCRKCHALWRPEYPEPTIDENGSLRPLKKFPLDATQK